MAKKKMRKIMENRKKLRKFDKNCKTNLKSRKTEKQKKIEKLK